MRRSPSIRLARWSALLLALGLLVGCGETEAERTARDREAAARHFEQSYAKSFERGPRLTDEDMERYLSVLARWSEVGDDENAQMRLIEAAGFTWAAWGLLSMRVVTVRARLHFSSRPVPPGMEEDAATVRRYVERLDAVDPWD